MNRHSMRRFASVVAASALIVGGVAAGVGTAAAAGSADLGNAGSPGTTAPVEQAPHSVTQTESNISVTKEVVGDGTAAPGQKVTYRTTFTVASGLDRPITKIKDVHPAGFEYVEGSAKVNMWTVAGQKDVEVTPEVNAAENYIRVSNPVGWPVSLIGTKTLTFEATYRVPSEATVGSALDSGLSFDVLTFFTSRGWNPMGVFVTIRDASLGEGIASGSAELGLGSSDGNGSAGSAIINDPSQFVADVIGKTFKSAS
ncbi:hypothetical protein [Rhodococcus kronopolitis]|uniref:DUF11 domain-containing protein n=1 Tax=Rhodococcus kronopolitis TaxID=1460226 RepID=A0ABV9FPH3_9NOCA